MSDVHHFLNCQCSLPLKISISNSESLLFYTRLLMSAMLFLFWTDVPVRPYDDRKLLDCVCLHNWHWPMAFFNKPLRLGLSLSLSVALCVSIFVSFSPDNPCSSPSEQMANETSLPALR